MLPLRRAASTCAHRRGPRRRIRGRNHHRAEVRLLWQILAPAGSVAPDFDAIEPGVGTAYAPLSGAAALISRTGIHIHHAETAMLRYLASSPTATSRSTGR